jgi:hypothetical protein
MPPGGAGNRRCVFPVVYYGDDRGIIVEAIAAPGAWGHGPGRELSFDHRDECCRELGVAVAGIIGNAVRDHKRIGPRNEEYIELIERSLWMARAYGFSRIVVLPGHGGNIAPAWHAIARFNGKQSTCRAISGFEAFVPNDSPRGHAGAWETSSVMFFHSDLVALDRLDTDDPDEPTGVANHHGDKHPSLATAEEGRATVEGFIARIRDELGEIPPAPPLSDPDEDGVAAGAEFWDMWTEITSG